LRPASLRETRAEPDRALDAINVQVEKTLRIIVRVQCDLLGEQLERLAALGAALEPSLLGKCAQGGKKLLVQRKDQFHGGARRPSHLGERAYRHVEPIGAVRASGHKLGLGDANVVPG